MVEVVKTEREKEEEKMNKMRREKRSHYVPHNAYVILGEEERVRRGQSDSPSSSSSFFLSLLFSLHITAAHLCEDCLF